LATGGAVATVAENAAVQETDPTSALAESPVASIAGQIDMSRQLLDFSQPGMDEAISADLGADYATKLETQVLSGSGASGQTLGLRNVSGITSVTATNASPTPLTSLTAIGNLINQVSAAYGSQPSDLAVVMHPRRFNWIISKAGFNVRFPVADENVIVSTSIPTTLGAGTNQDVVLALVLSEVTLYERPVVFRIYEQVGSGTQTVRVSAIGYAALMANRQPAAIGILSGTELTPPTF
jgi:hypothetical protein